MGKRGLKWLNNEKGLTLIEVLAVIVIIGIIAAIAVPNIANILGESEEKADEQTQKIIQDAALLYLINENLDVTNAKDESDASAALILGGSQHYLRVSKLIEGGYLTAPESGKYVSQVNGTEYTHVEVNYITNHWEIGDVTSYSADTNP